MGSSLIMAGSTTTLFGSPCVSTPARAGAVQTDSREVSAAVTTECHETLINLQMHALPDLDGGVDAPPPSLRDASLSDFGYFIQP